MLSVSKTGPLAALAFLKIAFGFRPGNDPDRAADFVPGERASNEQLPEIADGHAGGSRQLGHRHEGRFLLVHSHSLLAKSAAAATAAARWTTAYGIAATAAACRTTSKSAATAAATARRTAAYGTTTAAAAARWTTNNQGRGQRIAQCGHRKSPC
jgi:hypothetical protein